MVVSRAGAELPVGVLPGGSAGRLRLRPRPSRRPRDGVEEPGAADGARGRTRRRGRSQRLWTAPRTKSGEGRPAEPRGLALGTARPRGEDGAAGGVLEGPGAAAAASRASCRLSAAGSLVGTGLLLPDPFGEAGVRDISSLLACVSSGSGSIILMRT